MNLDELIEWARTYRPTDAEQEEQIKHFAYGNVKIENPNVTWEMVEKAWQERHE